MENKEYIVRYLPTFTLQFNNILHYIVYELRNKKAAETLYNEVITQIETRSKWPKAYEIFKITDSGKSKYYKINVKNYAIFYVVKENIMEVRRIYYSRRNFEDIL